MKLLFSTVLALQWAGHISALYTPNLKRFARDAKRFLVTRNDTETTVDCDPGSSTGLKAECWEALGMEAYITAWVAANGTEAGCDTLGFAQCYLQFHGYNGHTCNLITSETCPQPETTAADYSSYQEFYTLWNIYAVYQFFNQYSQALSDGSSLAAQTIDAIVAAVAPPVETVTSTSSLMSFLASTMAVITMFVAVVPGTAGLGVGFIRGGLAVALDQSQKLGTTLTYTQTANDRFIQLGDIGADLASLVEDYQENLLETVTLIQGNATIFNAACSEGGFSQRITTSLTIQASTLFKQLQVFILSTALKANGIVAARSTGVHVLDFATQTDAITCQSFTEFGNCYQWWYDEAAGNTYSLHNPSDISNTQVTLTNAINDNGWANMSDIFNVESCSGQTPTFDSSTLGITCMATHGWCEWNYPTLPNDARTQAQFTNCDNDDSWGTLCSSWTSSIQVPESYLGPLLLNEYYYCKPCKLNP